MKPFLSFLLAATLTLAAELPSGETILARYIESTGGEESYRALKSQSIRATIEFVGQGIKGTTLTHTISPGRTRTQMELSGIGKIEAGGIDGLVWEASAVQGPRILKGEERAFQIRLSDLRALLHWQQYFDSLTTEAEESIDGQAAYKVAFKVKSSGKIEYNWYAKDSGLLLKSRFTLVSPMGELPVESTLSDYRKVNGRPIPHKSVQSIGPQKISTTVEELTFNPDLDAATFEPPADIKALAAKQR